jgi:hypothetical protein
MFKKLQHSLGKTFGGLQSTKDDDFEAQYARLNKFRESSKSFQTHTIALVGHLNGFSSSLKLLSVDIINMFGKEDPMAEYAKILDQVSCDIDSLALNPTLEKLKMNCVEPLDKVLIIFDEVKKKQVKQRNDIKIEYDLASSDFKKITEQPQQKDPNKLIKAKERFNKAKESYETISVEVKQKFQEIESSKESTADPCIKSLAQYSEDCLVTILDCFKKFNQPLEKYEPRTSSQKTFVESKFSESLDLNKTQSISSPTTSGGNDWTKMEWFYLDANVEQKGPVSFAEMKSLYQKKKIDNDTNIFCDSMTSWKTIGEFPEFKDLL